MTAIKRFVVSRATWLRGSFRESSLLDRSGRQCCLGFVAEQLGVSRDLLLDESMPEDLDAQSPAFACISGVLANIVGQRGENTVLANAAIAINDDGDVCDESREVALSELFAAYGYELEFVDGEAA